MNMNLSKLRETVEDKRVLQSMRPKRVRYDFVTEQNNNSTIYPE